jgi:plastocyanin
MRTHWKLLTVALVTAAASSCGGGDNAPQRTAPPDAKRVDPARAANVTGRVTLEGPLPKNAPIKMSGDPACMREHKDGLTFETFVSENGGLGNVFVYVKDGLGNYFFDTPSEPVKLDQKGCMYKPHVFGVQVGQNVEFVNSDPTLHTVHALGNTNPEFNFSQPIQTQKDTKYFSQPEIMVRFKCDIHAWMSAYAGVLEHPYFAVTKAGGSFELKNVPAGTYTIEAWHEKLGTETQRVTLADNDKKSVTFTFQAPTTQP